MFGNYVHMLTISLLTVIAGIAHRDLKPENILCESPEKVLRSTFELLPLPRMRETSRFPVQITNTFADLTYQWELIPLKMLLLPWSVS